MAKLSFAQVRCAYCEHYFVEITVPTFCPVCHHDLKIIANVSGWPRHLASLVAIEDRRFFDLAQECCPSRGDA